ncbi:MAG: cupin domain-containing protein [Burkholderiaceae bacterium]|nr:cupin domain-containing protein [Burkholderiaceae bacterium]
MQIGHLFADAAPPVAGERFDTLLQHRNLQIERIVSSRTLAPQTWVQPQDEWVLLLQGDAVLDVDGQRVALQAGDHLFLPAGLAHRVESTSEGALWLAVHLHPDATP